MFNPEEHMIKLKGKDYLMVMWRLVWFREEHPVWSIVTEQVGSATGFALFRTEIRNENDRVLSTGHGSETAGDFGDYIEKAETKSIGRALAMLGFGTQFAPELDEGDRIVDSPVNRKVPEFITSPQAFDLQKGVEAVGDVGKFCKGFGIKNISEMTTDMYPKALKAVKAKQDATD